MKTDLLIGVVGPCAAGKSTLIERLKKRGYRTRHIAQEHSFVPNMWKRMTNPDILIYLAVSFEEMHNRQKSNWTIRDYDEQLQRLSHSREHADLRIETDKLTPQEALETALKFLDSVAD